MFDYKAYFKERTMRDYTVAMVLRMMADNGYMGQHAVDVLSETNAEITSEPFPGEAGLRQLYVHIDGQQFVVRFKVNLETGDTTVRDAWRNDEQTHVDELNFIDYWYPTYFPEGQVADRVKDWYAVADAKLQYKA
ncbi:hypothetical protein [Weissella confusa]|uniref:hypothetical protein n=1 Tax=Weissella confusa TaxID=1583 RepID=UPI001080A761|nr:hypothetical protein [Weissella confusa]MBJ7627828.1 hypothetical protein [Weissella confusa]TGE46684.1 hypothetical protein C6P23_09030 [Weissella confusa]